MQGYASLLLIVLPYIVLYVTSAKLDRISFASVFLLLRQGEFLMTNLNDMTVQISHNLNERFLFPLIFATFKQMQSVYQNVKLSEKSSKVCQPLDMK